LAAPALSSETITDLAYDHVRNLMYVAKGEAHIDLWTRSSGAWIDLTSRFPLDNQGQRRGNTVAVDPLDTSVVYVGSRGNYYRTDAALLRSLDAGATWSNLTLTAAQAAAGGVDGANEVMCVRVHPVTREAIISTNCFGLWRLAPPGGGGAPANLAPTAQAGSDAAITLPTSSVNLSGSGLDTDGTIASHAWTCTVKPLGAANPGFTAATSAATTVTGLVAGSYTFRLTVTDNLGATGYDEVVITVAAAPVINTPPTVSTVAHQTIAEDTATAALAVTVGDGETAVSALILTAVAADAVLLPASGISLGGSGANRTVTLTPAADRHGTTVVTLTVGDGTTTTSNSFTVTVSAVNDAPSVGSSLAMVTGQVGTAVDVILPAGAFVDGDGDPLTWEMNALPAGLTFDPATRRLSGTPTAAGDATVVVTASDPGGLTVSQTVVVRVLPAGSTAGPDGTGSSTAGATASSLTPTTTSGDCGLGSGLGMLLVGLLVWVSGGRRPER
jgi:hypothetical protein